MNGVAKYTSNYETLLHSVYDHDTDHPHNSDIAVYGVSACVPVRVFCAWAAVALRESSRIYVRDFECRRVVLTE